MPGVSNTQLILELMIVAATKAAELGQLFRKSQLEGRDVTDEEVAALQHVDDAERTALQAEIDKRLGSRS